MMSDFEKNARRELVAVCNAMVSGDVDLIDGSRLLVALRRDLGAVEDELFFPIFRVRVTFPNPANTATLSRLAESAQ
jgi:hypothetical protein